MIKKDQERSRLQSYEKPKLRTIELAAEEVLGIGCKTEDVIGPEVITELCIETQCAAEGS